MQYARLEEMQGGWWIGNFKPSILQTTLFEVAYKCHRQGTEWPTHYQETATEYNLLVHGTMHMTSGTHLRLKHRLLTPGDIFIVEPGEITKPVFLEDVEVMVVKVPSLPSDKIVLHR